MTHTGAGFQFEGLALPVYRPPAPVPSRQIRWPGASCRSRRPLAAGQDEVVPRARAGSTRLRCRTRLYVPTRDLPRGLRAAVRVKGEKAQTVTDVKERCGEDVWPGPWSLVQARPVVHLPTR